MATTPRTILTAAYARSKDNRPGTLANDQNELRLVVARALHGLFAVAARVNPGYFGKPATLATDGTGWALPADVESLVRLERITTGPREEVAVVPFDDQSLAEGRAAVYVMGRKLWPVPAPEGPVATENLRAYYSRSPAVPLTLDTVLDAAWPSQFDELLAVEVAIYLAFKDRRLDETPQLIAERNRWLALYVAHLAHMVGNEERRFGPMHRMDAQEITPILSLLAGGAPA